MKVNHPLTIDLNSCKKGDILILRNKEKVKYLFTLKSEDNDEYKHLINHYITGGKSIRLNNGKFTRDLNSEFDVIRIIKK